LPPTFKIVVGGFRDSRRFEHGHGEGRRAAVFLTDCNHLAVERRQPVQWAIAAMEDPEDLVVDAPQRG